MARPGPQHTPVDLLALGEVVLDVEARDLPAPGRRVHGDVRARPGGSPVNAARAAVAAGASAAVAGRVGDDWAGRAVTAELEREGIVPLLAVDPVLSTGVVVSVEAGAAPRGVVASRGASGRLGAQDVPVAATPGALLVSGYALLGEGPAAAAAELALTRIQAEWRAVGLASAGLLRARGRRRVLALLADADAVLGNRAEAEALTSRADPAEAARALAEGRRLACVTAGPEGAVAVLDGELVRARPPHVSAGGIGAGDALAGTLLALLLRGVAAEAALARACAAGAGAGAGSPG